MRPWLALSLVALLACSGSSGGNPTIGCNRTTDCSTGLVCNGGTCIAPGSVGANGACTASRDCSGNSFCSPAGRCAAAGSGTSNAACVSDADCASGLRCELYGFGGTCVAGGQAESGDDCTASKACLPGLFCSGGICTTFALAFPAFRGVQCALDPAPFHSYFVVPRPSNSSTFDDLFRLPWPNDARVSTATPPLDLTGFPHPGVTPLGVDIATLYAQALAADFDGFSAMTPIEFRFNGMPDFTNGANGIVGGGRIHLLDVTPGPTNGQEYGNFRFSGHSQGSTHGELALAFSNAAGAAVVSGAGANLRSSLVDKKSPVDVADAIGFLLGDSFTGDHPMGLLWQNYFDRSDPANYNRLTILAPPTGLTPKNVMMTWGVGDTYAPPSTLYENTISLGLLPVMPVLEYQMDSDGNKLLGSGIARAMPLKVNGVFGAMFQYQPSGYDGHFVAQMNSDAQRDWSAFLTSFFTTGTPTVP